jgi:glutaredoxin
MDQITVYGAPWCPDCRRSKALLLEQRVPFTWVDIDADADGLRFVETPQGGGRTIPTIVFPDGSHLLEPSNAELAEKLGLRLRAERRFYDVLILGGGPAASRLRSTPLARARTPSRSSVAPSEARPARPTGSTTTRGSRKASAAPNSALASSPMRAATASNCCRPSRLPGFAASRTAPCQRRSRSRPRGSAGAPGRGRSPGGSGRPPGRATAAGRTRRAGTRRGRA